MPAEATDCPYCAPDEQCALHLAAVPMEVETPGGTFGSFTAAARAGYPFACKQFAMCENAADITLPHPVLGGVPTCLRCAERVDEIR